VPGAELTAFFARREQARASRWSDDRHPERTNRVFEASLVSTDYQTRRAANRRFQLLALIDAELERATTKFDRFNSAHEGWAIIREELDELWEHVKGNTGTDEAAMTEALQIATMALRYIYDLGEAPLPDETARMEDYLERFTRVAS